MEEIEKSLLELEKQIEIKRKEYEIAKRESCENREKTDFKKTIKNEEIIKIKSNTVPVKKDDMLNYYYLDKILLSPDNRIQSTYLVNHINTYFSPKGIRFTRYEISKFFESKNIEKKKIGAFVYYVGINIIDSETAKNYVKIGN